MNELALLQVEEWAEFEAGLRPVKMVIVKVCTLFHLPYPLLITVLQLRKLAFKIVNSTTKLHPVWTAITKELSFEDKLIPHDVWTC